MTELQQKQLAFLEETINHFNSNNRGVYGDAPGCSYEAGCAIGRKLPPQLARELDALPLGSVSEDMVFNRLPKELKELGRYFLEAVQSLHDSLYNWSPSGLSENGKLQVESIKEIFNLTPTT